MELHIHVVGHWESTTNAVLCSVQDLSLPFFHYPFSTEKKHTNILRYMCAELILTLKRQNQATCRLDGLMLHESIILWT